MSQIWNISGHRVAGRTACTAHCTLNGHFLLATFFFSFLSKMQKEWRIAPENGDFLSEKRRLNMRSAVVSTVRGVFFIISAVLMESSERILQFATVKPCEMDNRVPELWGNIRVSAIIREIYQSPACVYMQSFERSINRRHVYAKQTASNTYNPGHLYQNRWDWIQNSSFWMENASF